MGIGPLIVGAGAGLVAAIVYGLTSDMADKRGRLVAMVVAGCLAAIVLNWIFG